MPATFPTSGGDSDDEMELYTVLRGNLMHLSEVLQAMRQKYAHYAHIRALVKPFQTPVERVQPNLITKESLLSRETGRMKMLAAKVAVQIEKATKMTEMRDNMDQENWFPGERMKTVLRS